MSRKLFVFALFTLGAGVATTFSPGTLQADPGNPLIDYRGFAGQVTTVGQVRSNRRLSEEDFLKMAQNPKAVILDARSKEMFDLRHIRGAKNLNFSDMTEDALAKVIPSKETPILIYCNNNFLGAPVSFATKSVRASLNVHTFNALASYGYKNVYELKPLLRVDRTKLPFEGTEVPKPRRCRGSADIPAVAEVVLPPTSPSSPQ